MYIIVILLMIANIDSIGGYGLIFIFPFLASILENRLAFKIFSVFGILMIPLNYPLIQLKGKDAVSWLSDMMVYQNVVISLSAIINPIAVILMLLLIGIDLLLNEKKEIVCNDQN